MLRCVGCQVYLKLRTYIFSLILAAGIYLNETILNAKIILEKHGEY